MVQYKQPNNYLSPIPGTVYGELVVVGGVQIRGIFVNQADASADLPNCPAGSSVQWGTICQPMEGIKYPNFKQGSTVLCTLPGSQFAVLNRADSAMVALFPSLALANTFVAGQLLFGKHYNAVTGTLVFS